MFFRIQRALATVSQTSTLSSANVAIPFPPLKFEPTITLPIQTLITRTNSVASALRYRLRLNMKVHQLLLDIKQANIITDDIIHKYGLLYNQIRVATKCIANPLADPTWGFESSFCWMSDSQVRAHLMAELKYLDDGLKEEMRQLAIKIGA